MKPQELAELAKTLEQLYPPVKIVAIFDQDHDFKSNWENYENDPDTHFETFPWGFIVYTREPQE